MKRFAKALLFVLVVASLYGIGRLGVVIYDSYLHLPREPYAVVATQNSITIKWQTPDPEASTLHYGFFADTLNHTLAQSELTKKHSITISGLSECTKYFYSVDSQSMKIDNEERSFTTLCSHADVQKVWVIGDSGQPGESQTKVYEQFLNRIDHDLGSLSMWILLGDNAYRSGTQKQYNQGLFTPYHELVKRFVPWTVIGNHDARRWAYYDIFDSPKDGQSGGVASRHKEYFAVDNGNAHFVFMDSETVDLSSQGDMANWLREDLAKNTKPWTIVIFHTPPYSDGGHHSDNEHDSNGKLKAMREHFVPIFDEFGVDLVMNGHSHDYERSKLISGHYGESDTFIASEHIMQDSKGCYTKPDAKKPHSGTVYLVCGSSSKLDEASLAHPALPFSMQRMGSVLLTITPSTLTSEFIDINGTIADQFSIHKNISACEKESKR